MEHELAHGGGKVSYKDYIGALKKYHIPFFDRTYITSIDQDKLKEFDIWRIQKAGKVLNKSTLLNHNAALQMVFKAAVENQWMLPKVALHREPSIKSTIAMFVTLWA